MNLKRRLLPVLTAVFMTAAVAFPCFAMTAIPVAFAGNDGWYFYDAFTSIDDYQGTDLFTETEINTIRNNLTKAEEELSKRGIEFVIFLAPNKEHVYSEHMPDSYGSPASYSRMDQLYDFIKDDFRVVYPLGDIVDAKLSWPQYNFYYPTGTHWNELGGYIGARALMQELGVSLPSLGNLKITPFTVKGMDLAQMLGVQDTVTDTEYVLSGYGSFDTMLMEQDDAGNYIWYHTEGAPLKNMTIFGDSFSMAMAPYLGQSFSNIYLHRFYHTWQEIDEEQPSVVVYEVLERALDDMLKFTIK